MKLQDHMSTITKVAEVAGKEYSIEQALDKMEKEWENIKLEIKPYKDTGTYMIRTSEETSQLLDDHIVMTQSMSFSPYKKPFEDRISSWENKLKTTQDVLDEWITCQRSWLYLEPIFSSEDINRQLPVESKRYQTMERIWRKLMKTAKDNPQVHNIFTFIPGCVEVLMYCFSGHVKYLSVTITETFSKMKNWNRNVIVEKQKRATGFSIIWLNILGIKVWNINFVLTYM